jgi:hypothetical protein
MPATRIPKYRRQKEMSTQVPIDLCRPSTVFCTLSSLSQAAPWAVVVNAGSSTTEFGDRIQRPRREP